MMMMEVEPRSAAILQDLRLQSFDAIRFASYRTASKLRYIQKLTNLHLVDIWNVIEAFRENGLNTLEPQSEVSVARLETLVSSLYHNLNKRLPTSQQVPVDSKASLLLNWLLAAYSNDNSGKIRVFSIKVALATMCAGKLVDKLRYIFSQISDGVGQLVHWKLCEFLREILALPAAVYESPTFYYKDGLESELFSLDTKVTVNDFIGVLVTEPGPPCLVWLPLLQRFATVETTIHPTMCSVCHKENFCGFRYRCQRCSNYQLCQECFWHGRVSQTHQNDHEVKEYTSYKSPSKQIGHTLRKSFRCVPEKPCHAMLPRFPEKPEKTLNLSHIVPPSPLPSHNGFSSDSGGLLLAAAVTPHHPPPSHERSNTLDSRATGRSLDSATVAAMGSLAISGKLQSTSSGGGGGGGGNCNNLTNLNITQTQTTNDEEHRLIARYAARLAQESRTPGATAAGSSTTNALLSSSDQNFLLTNDHSRTQRELITQLESKNKEIIREIARLRRQQESEQLNTNIESPALMTELRALRQRKGELEGHLGALQDSRRQLMVQLEGLMKMLKNQQTSSPRSTPNSSPRSGKSPPIPISSASQGPQQQQQQQQQQPPQPQPQQSQQNNSRMIQQQQPQQHQSQISSSSMTTNNHIDNQLTSAEIRNAFMLSQNGDGNINNINNINNNNNNNNNGNGSIGINGRNPQRNDLHYAADSVTSAMSTLVRELNSDGSDDDVSNNAMQRSIDFDESQAYQQQQQQQQQEWHDKNNSNNVQWQEQFNQWHLSNTQQKQ